MTTSNTYTYADNRNQLIKDAYVLCGIVDNLEELTAEQLSSAVRILNRMIKSWFVAGYKIWAFEDVIVFPVLSQQSYNLGSTARACFLSDFYETTLAVSAVSADTTVTLTDASGFAVSDNIAIASGQTLVWRTVSSKAGNVITLSSALGADITLGAVVFGYTTNIPKPIMVNTLNVNAGNSQIMTNMIGYTEYSRLPSKNSTGTPSSFSYMPKVLDGVLYVYPTSNDETQYYSLSIQRPIQDFTIASDNPDFPVEWNQAIIYNLARALGANTMPADLYARISLEADDLLARLDMHDNEDAPTSILPSFGWC